MTVAAVPTQMKASDIDKTVIAQLLPALREVVAKLDTDVIRRATKLIDDGTLDGETAVNLWYQIYANGKVIKRLQTLSSVK